MKPRAMTAVALFGTIAVLGTLTISGYLNAQETTKAIKHVDYPLWTEQHQLLEVLAGDWTIKGHTTQYCPDGEGAFTAREHNELMRGGLFLVSRTQYSERFHGSNQIAFFGVDPKTKKFSYALYSNRGVIVTASGALADPSKKTLVGNAIEWTDKKVNVEMGGDQSSMKYVTEVVSLDEYRFRLEMMGQIWYEGVASRVAPISSTSQQ